MERVRLRLDGVRKSYGRRQVLCGVSLDVASAALVGVVGENGSGKTTLLRIACGELAPDAGAVERAGRVGYCPQHPVVNDTLTVDQHLQYFRVAYKLASTERADELLETLGLERCRDQRVGVLSGGNRQKLNLTLALMHDPPLLVLDEPYQGFDWDTYLRFWEIVEGLRRAGRAVLVVSHLAHDVARFDAVGHLREGRLALWGTRGGRGGGRVMTRGVMAWRGEALGTALWFTLVGHSRNRLAMALALFFVPLWIWLVRSVAYAVPMRFRLNSVGHDVVLGANHLNQVSAP
ncbi:ABC transporter ATP-binding protein [Streptomyces sp. NPDC050485]|uniref:ABC transporter ATP-binding protein n=1 Tax=Streptomyces sp. NPDC050485 TaxID=3365617 RepID=UPI0037B6D0DB